jgi:hypothetical protein
VRLAEQNKTLTEENPSKRVRLKFDRENPTRNRGCETRLKDKLCFFMILNSKQSKCKKSRSLRGGTPSPRKALSSCLLLVFASTAFYSPQSSVLAAGIPSVQLLSQAPESNINILYVSSNGGSDTGGNGSDQSPFKTLTYALSVAPRQRFY